MPRGTPGNVTLGPGYLYGAILGSTEPAPTVVANVFTVAWAAAWIPFGYTAEGSSFSYSPSYEPVEVAEELDPLSMSPTGREMKVAFTAAENTAQNWKRAMNGGTIVVAGATTTLMHSFEPPVLGAETYIMLGWEAEDHAERWIWRQCLQTGSAETPRRKGAEKAVIPMEFSVFQPLTGSKPFIRWSARAGETNL